MTEGHRDQDDVRDDEEHERHDFRDRPATTPHDPSSVALVPAQLCVPPEAGRYRGKSRIGPRRDHAATTLRAWPGA
jgi:hypothetical protein